MTVPILNAERRWVCPNCDLKDVTSMAQPHTRFHSCAGLAGISAPLVPEGTKASVRAVEREDYIGREHVTYDGNKRPIMSVITTRDDGQDCAVLAPTATGKGA
jgi:hypothetical protein